MTLHPLSCFAGKDLQKTYTRSSWALDYTIPINFTSRLHKQLLPARMHAQLTLRNSKLACVLQPIQGHSGLCMEFSDSFTWVNSQRMADSSCHFPQKFHSGCTWLLSPSLWFFMACGGSSHWLVDMLWNSNSSESWLTKLNRGQNPSTVESIICVK